MGFLAIVSVSRCGDSLGNSTVRMPNLEKLQSLSLAFGAVVDSRIRFVVAAG